MVPPGAKSTVSVRGAAKAASEPNARTRAMRAILIISEYSFLCFERPHGRHVGDRKRRQILVYRHSSESEPPHLHAEAAAARVVGDLRDAVFELRSAIVINGRERGIPALAVIIADAKRGAELIRGWRDIRIRVNLVAARSDEVTVVAHVHGSGAIDDAAPRRIVIALPLEAEAEDRRRGERGDDRRGVPPSIEIRKAGEVQLAREDVALARNQRASEGGIEIVFGGQIPREDLRDRIAPFRVNSIRQAELHFPRIGQQIGGVEQQSVVEVRYTGLVIVTGARLYDMLQLVAKIRLFVVDSRNRRKNEIELAFGRGPQQVRAGDDVV